MQELKRCPFCGGEAEYQQYGNEHVGVTKSSVICRSCTTQQVHKWKKYKFDLDFIHQKTAEGWNRRVDVIDKILEEIDKTMECGLIDYINGDPVITKKKAKDIIRKHMDDTDYPYIVEKDIEAVPPASKEFLAECKEVAKKYRKNDGWIPFEKRLPEKGENVLLCSDDGRMMIGVFQNDYYTAFGVAVAENYNQTMHNCVAWQSLPEPYRPERSEIP